MIFNLFEFRILFFRVRFFSNSKFRRLKTVFEFSKRSKIEICTFREDSSFAKSKCLSIRIWRIFPKLPNNYATLNQIHNFHLKHDNRCHFLRDQVKKLFFFSTHRLQWLKLPNNSFLNILPCSSLVRSLVSISTTWYSAFNLKFMKEIATKIS